MEILIADDDKHFRLLLTKLFKPSYHIVECSAGDEAFNEFKNQHGKKTQYDLVLLDLSMPGLDGLSVLKEIRKFEKEKRIKSSDKTKIVLITSDSKPDTRYESFQYECDAFLSKPLDMAKVARKFDKLGIEVKNISNPI
jgi:two-component system, chemotaxis family, chemotaxis protein CheY